MWTPSLPWNSRPAFYPYRLTLWVIGVHSSSLDMFCGLGKDLRSGPPGGPVGGTAGMRRARVTLTSHLVLIQTK